MNASQSAAITIVSGLPRAGTSLLMQMLEAGGLPVLTDGVRESDDDNLRGYYEYEPVKSTRRDASWLQHAAGKAVKVVYLLLKDLPMQYEYHVIFTRRDLQEVVRSQQVMLDRRGERGANLGSQEMVRTFQRQLQALEDWLNQRRNFRRLDVPYREVLADPRAQSRRMAEFLGVPLDIEAMAAVVEPSLYRQRLS
ncbi:MAG: sulfotransferase [Pirellulales bacterium]